MYIEKLLTFFSFSGVKILNKIYKMYPDTAEKEYAKRTCLVCKIEDGENTVKLAKYDKGCEHAEELLLKELRELDVGDGRLTITIYMNDIPCSLSDHGCADKLFTYVKANRNVYLTVYVTRLFKFKQKFCTTYGHKGCKSHTADHSCVIKMLKKHRCSFKAPRTEAWGELFQIMNIDRDDEIFREFWENYSIQIPSVGRSRKEEDKRIRSYLENISKK